MSTKTLLTADEFELLPEDDSDFVELDEGEVITLPMATERHGHVESTIIALMYGYVKPRKLGRVYTGDTDFRLSADIMRKPDIGFVRQERVLNLAGDRAIPGAPDLAVEIFSPSNSFPQLMRKTRQYFAAGCHTVWIVYPETREIHVIEASGGDRILHAGDTLDAPELLPGFSVPVSEIFE